MKEDFRIVFTPIFHIYVCIVKHTQDRLLHLVTGKNIRFPLFNPHNHLPSRNQNHSAFPVCEL